MITCGNCRSSHESPADVRACYAGQLVLAGAVRPERPSYHPTTRTLPGERCQPKALAATEKQVAFLNKLLEERPALRSVENLWPDVVARLSKSDASAKITELLATPKERTEPDATITVGSARRSLTAILLGIPDGYYAIRSKTGHNDLDFIRVGTNQGRENPANKGKRRVQRVLGGQGNVSIRYGEAVEFAELIATMTDAERDEARQTFGRELGRCGRCGKTLTDETSRAFGIGPDCRSKF